MALKLKLAIDDIALMSGGVVIRMTNFYRMNGRIVVEIEVAAPREIKIHRFHAQESDERLTELLGEFTIEEQELLSIGLGNLVYE